MRLIDADALLKDVTSHIEFCEDILEIIDAQPSLDKKLESAYAEGFTFAESKFHERTRGKWIDGNGRDNFIHCSVCDNEAYWDTDYGQQEFDFCPYCGADMRGDK